MMFMGEAKHDRTNQSVPLRSAAYCQALGALIWEKNRLMLD